MEQLPLVMLQLLPDCLSAGNACCWCGELAEVVEVVAGGGAGVRRWCVLPAVPGCEAWTPAGRVCMSLTPSAPMDPLRRPRHPWGPGG
jgi:hypothetical protein